MEQWRKNLYVLWAGCLVASISFSFVSPFLPIFLEQMEVRGNLETWSGALYSAAFLSSCILSPVWGSLADRYGRKVMIVRAGIGMGVVNVLLALSRSPLHVLLLRLLNGVVSGFIPSSIALVATNTPESSIGASLGLLRGGSAAGSVLGPLIGGVMAHYLGIRMTFVVAAFTLWTATAVVIFGVKEIAKPLGKAAKMNVLEDLRSGWKNREFRALMAFVAMINGAVMVLQPILTPHIMSMTTGDASLVTGIVFSLTGVATVIAAPRWGKVGSATGFRRTMPIGMMLAGLLNLPQALAHSVASFGALRFLYGLAYAGAQVSIDGLTAEVVTPEFRGRAYGISQSFSQLGAVLGPLAGGVLGTTLGINSVFVITGVSLTVLGASVNHFLGGRPRAKETLHVSGS